MVIEFAWKVDTRELSGINVLYPNVIYIAESFVKIHQCVHVKSVNLNVYTFYFNFNKENLGGLFRRFRRKFSLAKNVQKKKKTQLVFKIYSILLLEHNQ